MKIFGNIILKDRNTIRNAFIAIIAAAEHKKRKGLLYPWSLAELSPDNEDFHWIWFWAIGLDIDTASIWLSPGISFKFDKIVMPCQIAIGTLLLFLTSEIARREAEEGQVWAVCSEMFSLDIKRALFDHNNQPSQLYKTTLEEAAKWLQLRHVFGIEGLQNWLDTTYLQFGFTYRGFKKRLPEWLAGQNTTQSIKYLLDPIHGSKSFKVLWDALRAYRASNITEARLCQIIAESPWVLPEWTNDLVIKAKEPLERLEPLKVVNPTSSIGVPELVNDLVIKTKEHLECLEPPKVVASISSPNVPELVNNLAGKPKEHLERLESLKVASISSPEVPELVNDLAGKSKEPLEHLEPLKVVASISSPEVEVSFLSQPTLTWNPPSAPIFSCQVTDLDSLKLLENSYNIIIGNRLCAQLVRQRDNSYQVLPSVVINLPEIVPMLLAKIVTIDGQIVHSMSLELWDISEDVTVYNLSSKERLPDPWQQQMKTSSAYVLLLAPDLRVSPEPKYWQVIDKQQVKLYLLSNNWLATTKVFLEDELFWQPSLSSTSRPKPVWVKNIRVQIYNSRVIQLKETVSLAIGHTPDIEVTFVRYDGLPLDFKRVSNTYTSIEAVILSMANPSQKPFIRIGLTNGSERISIIKPFNSGFCGVLKLTQNGWERFNTKDELTVEEASSSQFKIFPPEVWNREEVEFKNWALMEGEVWLGRLWKRPHIIIGLAGFGAPLTVRHGAYNSFGGNAIVIANSVVNKGVISEVLLSTENLEKVVRIILAYPVELDNNHHVIWWGVNGVVSNIRKYKIFIEEKTVLKINFEQVLSSPIAVALAYNGVRLSSWWSTKPPWVSLFSVADQKSPLLVAALLRWFHLPILNSEALPFISRFAELNPESTLLAWLKNLGLLPFLSAVEINESWLSVVRIVFRTYVPKKHEGIRIITALLNLDERNIEDPANLLEEFVLFLMRVDPLLMGKILVAWVDNFYTSPQERLAVGKLLQKICYNIANIEYASEQALQKAQKGLLQEIAETMQLDSNFVQLGLINRAIESFKGKVLKSFDEANIALAISIKPFRRLLSIQILETIASRK